MTAKVTYGVSCPFSIEMTYWNRAPRVSTVTFLEMPGKRAIYLK